MKIRDLVMPSSSKLEYLSSFLIDFYTKNVISNEKLKQYYDIYFKFKEKFTKKYPGKYSKFKFQILREKKIIIYTLLLFF